jgi:hypothetical protein
VAALLILGRLRKATAARVTAFTRPGVVRTSVAAAAGADGAAEAGLRCGTRRGAAGERGAEGLGGRICPSDSVDSSRFARSGILSTQPPKVFSGLTSRSPAPNDKTHWLVNKGLRFVYKATRILDFMRIMQISLSGRISYLNGLGITSAYSLHSNLINKMLENSMRYAIARIGAQNYRLSRYLVIIPTTVRQIIPISLTFLILIPL